MPMVRGMRMLNAVEAGTLSGAELETLLTADPGRLAELNALLDMRGQARRMSASSTAMTAFIASSTAMAAIAESSTAMAAVIASSRAMAAVTASSTAMATVVASSTAMTVITASSTAMAAMAESATARLAIYNSDKALNNISASTTGMAALTSSPQYETKTSLAFDTTAQSMGLTGKAIILKVSQSWSSIQPLEDCVIEGLRSGTTISGTRSIGSPPDGIYAPVTTPEVTWVLPAESNATYKNTFGNLMNRLHVGFIYV